MKDLFRSTFAALSKFDYEDYLSDFVRNAPFWLLHAAATANPSLGEWSTFPGLYSHLCNNSAASWNNPELYPHLFHLLTSRGLDEECARRLGAIEAHLGLRDLCADVFTHRYFRLHAPIPQTFELVDGKTRAVPGTILAHDSGFPIVYMPIPHLFDDVVGGDASYVGSAVPMERSDVDLLIRSAADQLRRYDRTLYEGFTETVGTLAITGEWIPGNRSSYSSGSLYTGGIFTSLCSESPILIAESLIHEYYHQRLWLWWLVEPPGDMPERQITMVSPVTAQVRPVQVMMQALLIYVSLSGYYEWAHEAGAEQSTWIGDRCRALVSGANDLVKALREILAGRSESLRFVEAVATQIR